MGQGKRFENEVGYRKPPKKSQFQKGTSGNPKGRPKGSSNLRAQFTRILEERVIVNDNGRRKSITKREATLKQQVNKAASGDPKAFQLIIPLLLGFEEAGGDMPARAALPEEDRKVLENFLKRCEKPKTSGGK
jgi:hypothetical protein